CALPIFAVAIADDFDVATVENAGLIVLLEGCERQFTLRNGFAASARQLTHDPARLFQDDPCGPIRSLAALERIVTDPLFAELLRLDGNLADPCRANIGNISTTL